jgi:hypothetical protein
MAIAPEPVTAAPAVAHAPVAAPPVAPVAPAATQSAPTPAPSDPAASTNDPTQDAVKNLEHAVAVAPKLAKAPGAALDAATAGGNITNSAQALQTQGDRHVIAQAAAVVQQGHPDHPTGIWGALDDLGHDAAHTWDHPLDDAKSILELPLNAMNVGMKESQHEFRYLYDVAVRHGIGKAIGEGLVMLAAGAAGVLLTPFTGGASDVAAEGLDAAIAGDMAAGGAEAAGAAGAETAGTAGEEAAEQGGRSLLKQGFRVAKTVLTGVGKENVTDDTGYLARRGLLGLAGPAKFVIPAQAAGYAESHVLYRDSWNRTASAQYRAKNGMLVNPGNVIAGYTGLHGGMGSVVSGFSNALFDLFTDPVNAGLSDVGGVKELAGGAFGKVYDRSLTAEHLEKTYSAALDAESTGSRDPQALALLRAIDRIAGSNASTLYREWPGFVSLIDEAPDETGHVVKGLASATTRDEVMDRFRLAARTGEATNPVVPSLSLAGSKMRDLRKYLAARPKNYLHPILGGIRHPTQLFGSLALLTERVPGTSFDEATNSFVNKTANLASGRGFDLLRQQYAMGLGPDQASQLIDLLRNADMGTKRIIYRNGQLMTLLGHAGLLHGPVDVESANWFDEAKERALDNINKPKFREAIQRKLDEITAAAEDPDPDATGQYSATRDGAPPRPLVDAETGNAMAGAVLENQTGEVPVMNWGQLHHVAQQLAAAQTFTGTTDDFMTDHFTDPFFKRWILLSGGYATRVALSEVALNATRLGIPAMMKAAYYNTLARMTGRVAREVDPAEIDSFSKAAVKLLTGGKVEGKSRAASAINRWSRLLTSASASAKDVLPADEREMSKVMDFLTVTGGNTVTRGLAAHGNIIDSNDDLTGKATGKLRSMLERSAVKHGKRFVMYGNADEEHLAAWAQHLGVTANDRHSAQAARAIEATYAHGGDAEAAYNAGYAAALDSLKKMDPVRRADFAAATQKREGDPAVMTPLESWAHVITENVMAVTHDGTDAHNPISSDLVPGSSLLHRIATNASTYPNDLKRVPVELRPRSIPGREVVPSVGESVLSRIATLGYKRVLTPIINYLSRQPLTYAEYSQRYDDLEHLEKAGILTHEQVVNKAAAEATIHGIRFVHNLQDRTVLDQMVRNWVPFWFAQEQAYRRAGRLLVEDPGAFRRYMLEVQSAHDIVSKQQDSNGNQYFAIPGAGFLDHLTVGALGSVGVPTASINPTGFGGTLTSASVVFPAADGVRPDISPVVTIPAQSMYSMFEEFGQKYADFKPVSTAAAGALNDVVGSQNMQEGVLQQVIPNETAFRFIEAAAGNDTSFNSALMMTMQSLAYQQNVAVHKWDQDGRKGPMPDIVPPANASPEQLQGFISKLKSQTRIVFLMKAILGAVSPVGADVTVNDFGLNEDLQNDINSTKSVTAGFQKFLLAHPEATPYTVAKSTVATGGTLPDTAGALAWIENNKSLLNQYQYGGMWLMPNITNDTYSSTAYYEEIASGLRVRDTPQQYLNALYTAAGDQTYYAALTQHENILSGLPAGSQAANTEYARWSAYMQQLQKQQPIWWASYNSGQRQSDAQRSINELTELYAQGTAPATKTAQGRAVGALLSAFQQAEASYVQAGTQEDYSTAQKQVVAQWQSYVDALAQQEPQLASVVASVFRDGLSNDNVS